MSRFNLFIILAANVFLAVGGYFISQKIAQNAAALKSSHRTPSSVSLDEQLNDRILDRQRHQALEQARKKEKQKAIEELIGRLEKDGFKVYLEDEQLIVEN